MSLSLQEITTESQFHKLTSSTPSSHIFILYFHTPWAAPCTQMTTILAALASTYPSTRSSDLTFLSINAEDLPEISETYDVTAVPFTVVVQGGKVLESLSGSDAGKVRSVVEKHAGSGGGGSNGLGGKTNGGIPPALKAEPQQGQNGVTPNGSATKDLSAYKPAEGQAQSIPVAEDKEELNERLGKLVKAA